MRNVHTRKKRSRWTLCIILALALIINGSFLGEAYATEYVAAIGTVNYQTLEEAFDAVTEGQTIRLLCPVDIAPGSGTGVVDKPGVSFYLDLGNKVISGNQKEALIQVNAGSLTVYNGVILNNNSSGLAIAKGTEPTAKIAFPIGYQKPDPLGAQLDIPNAYHIDFTTGTNGSIHYGSTSGLKVPLTAGNLYAGENIAHNFYFVANVGYKVGSFAIDGISQTVVKHYTISNLTANKTMKVTFNKITFAIAPTAYVGTVPAARGVTLTPASATVAYGGSQTFQFTVNKGYKLKDVLVNNISIGAVKTITLTNVTTQQNIKIILEKTALFIMLDAGHYEFYNHSPVVSSYYEGNAMWILHGYVKKELELYPNIIVDTTRPDNSRAIGSALGPWERGAMGAGYDLVLSLHSNAASTSSVTRVVGICTQDSRYASVSKGLATKLVTKVGQVMGITQAPSIYTKTQSDGQDWYGINRGATSVGVPSIILEHSFHTNYTSAKWLLLDANLRTLAVAEAKVIADYYGISKPVVVPAPKVPTVFTAYGISYNKVKIRWNSSTGATGYQVYRSSHLDGSYTKIKTTSELAMIDSGLNCGQRYYYKVRAYTSATDGTKYSTFTTPNVAKPRLSQTTLYTAGLVHKANLRWDAVSGAQGYQIFRANGTTGTWVKIKTIRSNTTVTWSDIRLTTGKTYSYKVRGYRIVNEEVIHGACSVPRKVTIK